MGIEISHEAGAGIPDLMSLVSVREWGRRERESGEGGKELASERKREARGEGGKEGGRGREGKNKRICASTPPSLPLLPSLSFLLFFPPLQLRNPDTPTSEKKDPTHLCSRAHKLWVVKMVPPLRGLEQIKFLCLPSFFCKMGPMRAFYFILLLPGFSNCWVNNVTSSEIINTMVMIL